MTDLMLQKVTKNTALGLRMVDGSFHVWYPGGAGQTYGELVLWLQRTIKTGGLLRVGDPERYSDLCSVVHVNAAHIVSFVKQGGTR